MKELKQLAFVVPIIWMFNYQSRNTPFTKINSGENQLFTLRSYAQVQSNAITSKFAAHFLNSTFIPQNDKDAVRSNLSEYNRIGVDWDAEISYALLNDSLFNRPGWSYYGGIKSRTLIDIGFRREVFELGFYGNAPFAGQTLDLSNTEASLTHYQQLQFGMFKQWNRPKSYHTFGMAVSFINGSANISFSNAATSFKTTAIGDSIQLNTQFSIKRSDPEEFAYFFPNGQGFAVDLFYEYRAKNGLFISVNANDMGFIIWNDLSRTASKDTNATFTGAEINDLYTINGKTFSGLADTLKSTFALKEDSTSYRQLLPFQFGLHLGCQFQGLPLLVQGGAMVRVFSQYAPLIYLRTQYYPTKWLLVGGNVSYGGYGGINIGGDLGFNFGKGVSLSISTRNLESVVPNNTFTGMSAGFRFQTFF